MDEGFLALILIYKISQQVSIELICVSRLAITEGPSYVLHVVLLFIVRWLRW